MQYILEVQLHFMVFFKRAMISDCTNTKHTRQ